MWITLYLLIMKCSKTTLINCFLIFFTLMVFPSTVVLYAQTINPQKLLFDKICAGKTFNEFDVNFKFSGFPSDVVFVVELSDNMGSFTTPTATTTLKTIVNAAGDITIQFAVPTTLKGSEIYHLRVKSSTGFASGDFNSAANIKTIPAYFKVQDAQFTINNNNQFATYCTGGSVVLTIDNPGTGTNDSPLKYPSLTYNWFKEPSLTPIATTSSLQVNQPGVYYVETNYGSCNPSLSYSNRVTINTTTGGAVATITSSLGNPFCSTGAPTILSTPSGNSFIWKKDNAVIVGATSNTYQTNEAGLYTVDVDFGGCVSTGSIDLKKDQINSSVECDGSIINEGETRTINEGEIKTLIVTTDALMPTYSWYLNNVLIAGATGNTFDATAKGSYKVSITQTSGCVITDEISFELSSPIDVVNVPNLISPNGDGINDTWIIPQEYASGTNTEVLILSSYGKTVLKTNDYDNNNGWPESPIEFKSVNPVYYYIITPQNQQVKRGSITVVK